MEGGKKTAKPRKPHVLRAGHRQAGGHWQPAGSLDRDGWNPKASWASACHTHTQSTGWAAQLGTSPMHAPQDTPRMDMHLQHTRSHRALWGSIFTNPRLVQHPTLQTGTHRLSCRKEAGVTLAGKSKGLLGCSLLQQPRAHSNGMQSFPQGFNTMHEGPVQESREAGTDPKPRKIWDQQEIEGREVCNSAFVIFT